jgi:transcriptional regulator with GAF, ATPase, and Fis domain
MAYPGIREGLAQKVDTAAREAERLGLTTATLILRMARLEIDRAELDEVESMPRNNLRSMPY